jgi:hypothetical protein
VQRRAQSTDRVNGVIIAELVTGQNISAHFHDGLAGCLVVDILRDWGALSRRIAAAVIERPLAVRHRHRHDRVVARAPNCCAREDAGKLGLSPHGDPPLQMINTVYMFVERRLTHTQAVGERSEREPRQSDIIGNPLRFVDHPVLREPRSRHAR